MPTKSRNRFLDFDAKEVFLVMRSTKTASKVRVYLDGKLHSSIGDVIEKVVTVDAALIIFHFRSPTYFAH